MLKMFNLQKQKKKLSKNSLKRTTFIVVVILTKLIYVRFDCIP